MDNEINIDGFCISTGVVETIVTLATAEIDGIAGVGTAGTISGIYALIAGKRDAQSGIEVSQNESGGLVIAVRIQVYYGYKLTEVAAKVRAAVADAVLSQIGVQVAAVDILVDGVVFANPE